jgi:hypothetical protein
MSTQQNGVLHADTKSLLGIYDTLSARAGLRQHDGCKLFVTLHEYTASELSVDVLQAIASSMLIARAAEGVCLVHSAQHTACIYNTSAAQPKPRMLPHLASW